jgi:hypothetical protein
MQYSLGNHIQLEVGQPHIHELSTYPEVNIFQGWHIFKPQGNHDKEKEAMIMELENFHSSIAHGGEKGNKLVPHRQ